MGIECNKHTNINVKMSSFRELNQIQVHCNLTIDFNQIQTEQLVL